MSLLKNVVYSIQTQFDCQVTLRLEMSFSLLSNDGFSAQICSVGFLLLFTFIIVLNIEVIASHFTPFCCLPLPVEGEGWGEGAKRTIIPDLIGNSY